MQHRLWVNLDKTECLMVDLNEICTASDSDSRELSNLRSSHQCYQPTTNGAMKLLHALSWPGRNGFPCHQYINEQTQNLPPHPVGKWCSEFWSATKDNWPRFAVIWVGATTLHWNKCIARYAQIRHEGICHRCEVTPIVVKLVYRHFRWYGHLNRVDECLLVKLDLKIAIDGKWPKDRSKRRLRVPTKSRTEENGGFNHVELTPLLSGTK